MVPAFGRTAADGVPFGSQWVVGICLVKLARHELAIGVRMSRQRRPSPHGEVPITHDGGKTWTKQESSTEKTLFAVSFIDKLHGWASGDESTYVWTDNGGESWNVERIEVSQVGLNRDMSLAVPDIIYYGIYFLDAQHGWMVGEYGNIRNTTDGGATWGSQHGSLLDELRAMGVRASDVMSLAAFFRVHFTDPMNGLIMGGGGAVIGAIEPQFQAGR